MGRDSVSQKGRFLGLPDGPQTPGDVFQVYDFKGMKNVDEIPSLMEAVVNGAEQAGYDEGIIFMNYK